MGFQNNSRNQKIAILFIILLLSGYWVYSTQFLKGPDPYYRDNDPEMAYFMNSLAIFKGEPYFYTDHPGTPVEVLGTLILGLTYPFLPERVNFIDYHIQSPERFLNLAHAFIAIFSIGCAVYFFMTVSRSSRLHQPLVALSLAVMFYGLHPYSFTTLTIWSHTAFNFPLGTFYFIVLFKLASKRGEVQKKAALGIGLATGILIALMINFLPWLITTLIFVIIYYRLQFIPWSRVVATGSIIIISSIIGFLLSVLPSIHRMHYFLSFLQDLLFHQLPYGNGPEGITSLPLLWENLKFMFVSTPTLFIYCAYLFSVTFYIGYQQRNQLSNNPGMWALGMGMFVQSLILILLVAKHPGERFLLPLAATLPVLSLVLLNLSEFSPRLGSFLKKSFVLISMIGVIYFGGISLNQKKLDLIQTRHFEEQSRLAIQEQAKLMGKNSDELIILWSNATYSYCSSLVQGDYYASGVFSQEVSTYCPNQTFFQFNRDWVLFNGTQTTLDTLPWDIIITRLEMLERNPFWLERGTTKIYPNNIAVLQNK